jgi:NAD-dependent deacetylase
MDESLARRETGPMSDTPQQAAIERARDLVDASERIVVLTGAGISTDSGIADFRGPQGLWTKNPEAEKMATLQHYMADPEIRRRSWKAKLEGVMHRRQPNAGHRALVALEARGKLDTLITQNVDGLHGAAGSDAGRIVEIHGTITETSCMACGEQLPIDETLERVEAGEGDPPCLACGGILKSATISFGQGLVAEDLERAGEASRHCDLMFAIGTTLGVYPIAGVVPTAHECGAPVIILNGEPTEMDGLANVLLRGSISEVLPQVVGAGVES